MAAYKKKTVWILAAIVLICGVKLVCTVNSGGKETTRPLFDNSSSLFSNAPAAPGLPVEGPKTQELFLKMMFAVLLVIVLGAAALYVSKKFLPRITHLPSKRIRVVETAHLGPRKTVHLLKIGSRLLLIGSTAETITRLADVTEVLGDTDMSATEISNNYQGYDGRQVH